MSNKFGLKTKIVARTTILTILTIKNETNANEIIFTLLENLRLGIERLKISKR